MIIQIFYYGKDEYYEMYKDYINYISSILKFPTKHHIFNINDKYNINENDKIILYPLQYVLKKKFTIFFSKKL